MVLLPVHSTASALRLQPQRLAYWRNLSLLRPSVGVRRGTNHHRFTLLGPKTAPLVCHTSSVASGKSSEFTEIPPSASGDKSIKDDHLEPDDEIVLFQRNRGATQTITVLRSGFIVSTCHTAYWIWYNTDFIPLVNASPMESLHISPTLGLFGLALAAAINIVFIAYPRRLIASIAYRPYNQEIVVYTYRLPLIRPSLAPSRRISLSSSESSTSTTTTALQPQHDLPGDLRSFRGHLKIGDRWPRYTMEVTDPEQDIVQPALLLDALVDPPALVRRHVIDEDGEASTQWRSSRFRKKRSHRGRVRHKHRR